MEWDHIFIFTNQRKLKVKLYFLPCAILALPKPVSRPLGTSLLTVAISAQSRALSYIYMYFVFHKTELSRSVTQLRTMRILTSIWQIDKSFHNRMCV